MSNNNETVVILEPEFQLVEENGDRKSDHSKLMAAYERLDKKIDDLVEKKRKKNLTQ